MTVRSPSMVLNRLSMMYLQGSMRFLGLLLHACSSTAPRHEQFVIGKLLTMPW